MMIIPMLTILASVFVIGIVRILAKFLLWYFTKARRIIKMTSDIQSPGRHWLWGSMHLVPDINQSLLDWYSNQSEKYGGIFKVWFGPFLPWVTVCRPDLAKVILRTDEPKVNGIPGYGVFQDWIGMGLIMSRGDVWKRNRKLLTPAFHFDMLKSYLDVFNKTNDTFAKVMDALVEKGNSFDMFKPASLLTLDSVLRCVFSVQDDIQHVGEDHPVVKLSGEAQSIAIKRFYTAWQWSDILFFLSPSGRRFRSVCKQYNQITKDIIVNRKKVFLANPNVTGTGRRKDFLDTLLVARDEDGCGLSDDEILSEVNTFMFAGHDTTSSTLSWTLHALATHQKEQDACQAEIREILCGRDSDDISWEDLAKMNYLTMCIKETLRYNSTVPVISRELSHDLQVGSHSLPKGCFVDIILYKINRDPSAWENPHEFNPERFNQQNASERAAYSFVPFSAGPRNCIGQNFAMVLLKVSLARILNRFTVTYDASHPVKRRPEAVMKTEDGLWLKFQRV
jgi:cytochrome P450